MTVSTSTRRLTAAALTAAAVTSAIEVPASVADHRPHWRSAACWLLFSIPEAPGLTRP
ncbi:hypothetical protein [Streptomyces sp. NPDC055134]